MLDVGESSVFVNLILFVMFLWMCHGRLEILCPCHCDIMFCGVPLS